jgi:hypothetical protein
VWDALTGKGVDGPHIVLCHRHRHWAAERGIRTGKRFPVVHGWLGAANRYGYSSAVFEHERDSWVPAAWWWERRRPVTAGDSGRVDAA